MNLEQYQVLKDEMDRLRENKFISESFYLDYLSNPALVKRFNGKWRVCMDFANLKKACPKDSFYLPKINQLVDAIAEHQLLSFMEAYSEYNQIPMYPFDEEHNLFITDRGLYCYKFMLFGLKNTGVAYQIARQ